MSLQKLILLLSLSLSLLSISLSQDLWNVLYNQGTGKESKSIANPLVDLSNLLNIIVALLII